MNLPRIRALRRLQSAAVLLQAAGEQRSAAPRQSPREITIGGQTVQLTDQARLDANQLAFVGGWDFDRLLLELDSRVFLWACGTGGGLDDASLKHFEKYAALGARVLRLPTADLFARNAPREPEFCRANSGQGRMSNCIPARRGPDTYCIGASAGFPPSEVREVTYRAELLLPDTAEVADRPGAPWRPL